MERLWTDDVIIKQSLISAQLFGNQAKEKHANNKSYTYSKLAEILKESRGEYAARTAQLRLYGDAQTPAAFMHEGQKLFTFRLSLCS